MKMFLSLNDDDLQLPKMVLTKDMHRDYCKFMNALMDSIDEVLFQERLLRVLPKRKSMMQPSPDIRVED